MEVSLENGQKIKLLVSPITRLLPHESTIDSLLDSVRRDLSRTGFQRDPILIDEETSVVLDGMHRRAALQLIKAKFALCATYDYLGSEVILERWLRYFIAPDDKLIDDLIGMFGLKREVDLQRAIESIDRSKHGLALLSRSESYVGEEEATTEKIYRDLSRFDKLMESRGIEVQFHTEEELGSLFISKSVFVIYPRKLEKKEIIEVAKRGSTLPYKTTRHSVPIRPLGIYFPISKLTTSDLNACTQELERIVLASRVELVGGGQWYEGRRYTEPLAVFKSR